MNRLNRYLLILLFGGLSFTGNSQSNSKQNSYWPEIKQEAKPWTRWWWLGSAVDQQNLDRLIKEYADKGIGGVEITPIYGVKGEEANNIDFLSPKWISMLKETVDTGQANDLGVDMNTGTGWPFGGPLVTDEFAAKKMLFHQLGSLSQDEVNQFVDSIKSSTEEELIALSAFNQENQRINLFAEGSSVNDIDDDNTLVIAVTESNTGQKVKRAAPGGEGLVFNHFSKRSTLQYLDRFDKAFHGNPGVRCFFNDSYELESASAARELFGTFKKLKGYDLALYTREMSGEGNADTIARVKADYRDVLGDMLLHNFTQTWTNWANTYGAVTRNQAHGSPGNLIDLYAAVGIPEMETFHATNFPFLQDFIDRSDAKHTESNKLFKKFSSSAAHMKGENLVSCESFTWLNEHFKTPLYQCKAELDELFVKGVTHLFFHGTAYSPERAGWPGWCFYASTHMDPNNPQWAHIDAMNSYIARCQSVLQAGQHTNNFLVFWSPDDYNYDANGLEKKLTLHNSENWVNMPEIEDLLDEGYLFDFTTDRIIADMKVEGKDVVTVDRVPYKAILLPKIHRIKLATFTKLLTLADEGATIIFSNIPKQVSGFNNYQEKEAELAELVRKLQFSDKDDFQFAEKGKGAIYVGNAEAALKDYGIQRESLNDYHIKSISRKTDSGYYYFIANHEKEDVDAWLPFKYFAKNALLMNPMNGDMAVAETDQNKVKIALKSGESIIVYFTDDDLSGVEKYQPMAEGNALVLENGWKLKALNGGPELFSEVTLPELKFWTELDGDIYQNFAGTAQYTTTFKMKRPQASGYLLRLDKVEASVKVFVNDQEVATLWSFPFEVEVGKYLTKGENTLRLEVCNLAANRIRYMDQEGIEWKKFENINIVDLDYKPLDASKWEVLPSGISGNVELIEQIVK
ncbi:glycosyl hydrolase [Mangrovibacterium lignilyticum]|uniref:glycosyl hydrolase n=1 Tax=Mangrovibacterium lignilyticum TaxID=2668052 RepID=UPI0013D7CB1F|nr:glycosyl hydrolase [Mangrovibacterium lignilyticum]